MVPSMWALNYMSVLTTSTMKTTVSSSSSVIWTMAVTSQQDTLGYHLCPYHPFSRQQAESSFKNTKRIISHSSFWRHPVTFHDTEILTAKGLTWPSRPHRICFLPTFLVFSLKRFPLVHWSFWVSYTLQIVAFGTFAAFFSEPQWSQGCYLLITSMVSEVSLHKEIFAK